MEAFFQHGELDPPESGVLAKLTRGVRSEISELYKGSSWLTVTGLLMLVDIVVCLIGLVTDPTVISGAPAWMKPLKFAASISIFSFTMAWVITRLGRTRSFAAVVSRVLAASLVLEMLLISMQAARHTTSHFNLASKFDASVFQTMGVGIALVFLSTVLILGASCSERFSDQALGWAIRLGLVFSLAGMGVGSMMTIPTPQQLEAAHAGGGLPRSGGHSVGGRDGGAGMPVTGWSADHGDLRIAHFVGLHGMQVLLLGWWLTAGRWSAEKQTRLIVLLALNIMVVFGTVLWQALRGQPLLRPAATTAELWAVWLVLSVVSLIWLSLEGSRKAGSDFQLPIGGSNDEC